jgi:hypothetical protein
VVLGVVEQTGTGKEPIAQRGLKGEAPAAAGDDVNGQVSVLPVFELLAANVDRDVGDRPEVNVLLADSKLSARITHRRAAVTAAAALVEHEVTVRGLQLPEQRGRGRGDGYAGGRHSCLAGRGRAGSIATGPAGSEGEWLEESELLGAVTDQHVLGLLVVIEHHAVILAPDA